MEPYIELVLWLGYLHLVFFGGLLLGYYEGQKSQKRTIRVPVRYLNNL